jgi:hypothetical protein
MRRKGTRKYLRWPLESHTRLIPVGEFNASVL